LAYRLAGEKKLMALVSGNMLTTGLRGKIGKLIVFRVIRRQNQEARSKNQESRSKEQEARIKKQEARSKKQEARSKEQELRRGDRTC
jgi:hypothetical protein